MNSTCIALVAVLFLVQTSLALTLYVAWRWRIGRAAAEIVTWEERAQALAEQECLALDFLAELNAMTNLESAGLTVDDVAPWQ